MPLLPASEAPLVVDQEAYDPSPCLPSPGRRPYPRRSPSPASKARIVIKNRRKCYLDTHPEYITSPSHELADPLAYDRLIRRFQTPSEREAEGRKKGYSGVLEADLWRSEAKIESLAHPDHAASMRYRRGGNGEIVAEEKGEVPMSKGEGLEQWRREMEMRFLRGDDTDFDYGSVDESEEYDDKGVEEREEEEKWFEEEEPTWIDAEAVGELGAGDAPTNLTGQTGVQDF